MTEPEAAAYLDLAPVTLRQYRSTHQAPHHTLRTPPGGGHARVWYELCDLDAWAATRRRHQREANLRNMARHQRLRPKGEPRRPPVQARLRALAAACEAAEARVDEGLALWRAVRVEPHVAVYRLREDVRHLGEELAPLEQRLARLLASLAPEAIDDRAGQLALAAQLAEVQRWERMLESRVERRMSA